MCAVKSRLACPQQFVKMNSWDSREVYNPLLVKELRQNLSQSEFPMPPPRARRKQDVLKNRKRNKNKTRIKKKDPIFVEGARPRPMYVDYKDLELLKKLINRHGKVVSRRKTGCTAASQHAMTQAVKRARFMALLPYVGE